MRIKTDYFRIDKTFAAAGLAASANARTSEGLNRNRPPNLRQGSFAVALFEYTQDSLTFR